MFLERLLLKCSNAGWVDIENEFYTQLKEILYNKDVADKKVLLNTLNKSMSALIEYLRMYLSSLPKIVVNQAYYDIFQSEILKNDIAAMHLRANEALDELHVLTFNYTESASEYFKSKHNEHIEVNYIHGRLNDSGNPIIFGFGDELDEDYLKMEHEHITEYFTYIKSFWYFKTANYHRLIRFIDSDEYQIVTLGHGCGLSDRTMLNMIFEHDNCKSIKIYYHEHEGENNFTVSTQEISRNFRDKKSLVKGSISPGALLMPVPDS